MRRPAAPAWAVRAVEVATWWLPPGAVRRRYRDEFVAEMWGMTRGQLVRHVLSVLASGPALHHALFDAGELEFPHAPAWCRLHLHHRWHTVSTEDGERYHRCLECGADDDETTRRRIAGSMGIAHGLGIG